MRRGDWAHDSGAEVKVIDLAAEYARPRICLACNETIPDKEREWCKLKQFCAACAWSVLQKGLPFERRGLV
jgi:hypothetical protein